MPYIVWWRGWGILAIPLGLGIPGGVAALTAKYLGNGYWIDHGWPLGLGLALAGAAVWLLGVKVNGDVEGEMHSLYSIPMQYWGYVLGLASPVVWLLIALL